MRRCLTVVAVACALALPGCGVGSEDEPRLTEESTGQQPPATPSIDIERSPVTGSSVPTTLSATASSPAP